MNKQKLAVLLLILFTIAPDLRADEFFLVEEFTSLDSWQELAFPKIEKHSTYSIQNFNNLPVLKIESNQSASGLIFKKSFDIYQWPILEWKWLVTDIMEKGNLRKKSGDDYPIRIYVTFEYNPKKSNPLQAIQYGTAKLLYGEYPPDSSISYIWANREHPESFYKNPFSSRVIMIIKDYGSAALNQWRIHKTNLLEDYRRVFGKEPPSKASLAIMGDSDNTKEASLAYLDYIRLSKE